MEEVWKVIEECNKQMPDGTWRYSVSNLGRVRRNAYVDAQGRKHAEKILSTGRTAIGSHIVALSDGVHRSRRLTVHILVAEAFLDNPDGLKSVCHLDGDYNNNAVTNLRWGTSLRRLWENTRSGRYKCRPIIQYSLHGEFVAEFRTAEEAARSVGLRSGSYITHCCKRRPHCNSAGGYIWRYSDDLDIGDLNRWKPVDQLSLDGEYIQTFNTVSEAALNTGATRSRVLACCNNMAHSHFGFKWKFAEDRGSNYGRDLETDRNIQCDAIMRQAEV